VEYDLTDEYIAEARQRAYRFQGQWCGTAGSLAADVARLLIGRKKMQGFITELEATNAQLRAAVESRLGGNVVAAQQAPPQDEPDEQIPMDWILQGQKEMEASTDDIRWTGDSILAKDHDDVTPAEKLLMDAIDVVRDRRPKYGGPRHHFRRTVGMINAAFADVLKRPLTESDWAIFMTFDKVARFLGPNKTADGPIDLAGYAACLAECESSDPV
jgi:hypothetical protein